MKTIHMMIARLLFLSFILVVSASLARADVVYGQVQKVTGSAHLITPNGKSQIITTSTVVPIGSRIETGSDGEVVIQWVQGAYSVIQSNAKVTVTSLGYAQKSGVATRNVGLNLSRGSLYSHLAHDNGKSDFRIKTPKGVAAARGTDWVVIVRADGSVTVSVATSAVDVTGVDDIVITVKEGQLFNVTVNGSPVAITDKAKQQILDILALAGIPVGDDVSHLPPPDPLKKPLSEVPLPASIIQSQ